MSYRVGLKPGKAASALGLAVGLAFVLLGLVVIVAVFGPFGLLWTAVAGLITTFNAYNLFSERGVTAYEVDVDTAGGVDELGAGLRKLTRLRDDGLLSEQEYQRKQAALLRGGKP